MRIFIELNGDKIQRSTWGEYTDDDAKEILNDGFLEVNESNIDMFTSGRPLKYINDEIMFDTEEEQKIERRTLLYDELDELKRKLSETDYVVVKIAEGVATADEYSDVISQRAEWRSRINEIQKEI